MPTSRSTPEAGANCFPMTGVTETFTGRSIPPLILDTLLQQGMAYKDLALSQAS